MEWNDNHRTKKQAGSLHYSISCRWTNHFSRKGNEINKVSELEGKVVGVQLGSSGSQAVERNAIAPKLKEIKNMQQM